MKHPLFKAAWAIIDEGIIPLENCALRCSGGSENQKCSCLGPMDCPLGHSIEENDIRIQQLRARNAEARMRNFLRKTK